MSPSVLITIAVAAIFFLLFLVMKVKLHAFVALMLVSLLLGVAAGMPLTQVLKSVQDGMGGTLAEGSAAAAVLAFIGHPFAALLIATLLAFYLLGIRRGYSRDEIQDIATKALEPAGSSSW